MGENKGLNDEKLKKVSGGVCNEDTGVYQTYIVKNDGETLEYIAKQCDCSQSIIQKLNNITNPFNIPKGTSIIYPDH